MSDHALPVTMMPPGGLTTSEKIERALGSLRTIDPAEMPADARELVAGLQMAAGLGFDPLAMLLPADPTDADGVIDKMIALLLSLRGDDLPPFDVTLYGDDGGA